MIATVFGPALGNTKTLTWLAHMLRTSVEYTWVQRTTVDTRNSCYLRILSLIIHAEGLK